MGIILAKFRKEKTTEEVLEGLEENIQQLEKYTLNTQAQKRRFVSNFLAVSVGIYVIGFIIFYFVYFPSTWRERMIYFVPLLIFPLVIYLLRMLFTWYFQRKLNKNSMKLTKLRAEKKRILEQVMDKETYKVAVNLLARFGDKTNGTKSLFGLTPRTTVGTTPVRSLATMNSSQVSIKKALTPTPQLQQSLSKLSSTPLSAGIATTSPQLTLRSPGPVSRELRRRTPFPVVNQQEKSVVERLLDMLVGDGPQDRFAMICKQCYSHNGMALKEDFEYATFRCAFCNTLNPARKSRPIGPRLTVSAAAFASETGKHSTDSEPSSDTDSDDVFRSPQPVQETDITETSKSNAIIAKDNKTGDENFNSCKVRNAEKSEEHEYECDELQAQEGNDEKEKQEVADQHEVVSEEMHLEENENANSNVIRADMDKLKKEM